ncbi:NAD-dependent epimerase/dehydratase family protein [Rhodobacteraceae bacterium B1Z28]|uniref:NAD-dependent epimerase/dehydratase family protein n=1 Tax=Ruegeria haliotis TaxID=2747601 RepID=A0ABX2PWC8_9RHOB|nr:NAD-dependent epimerase/dehydratase family protein [Ruegeria haliotis]NVO58508.1 NAD-dependent epimerase/dehydratase family protein [Ruegeria haliotis]
MPVQAEQGRRPLGRVLLTGGTGMVGSSVLSALRNADSASAILSLSRRPSGYKHSKLTEVAFSEFGDAEAVTPHVAGIDTVSHCLATYSNCVSREAYEEITVNWLEALLHACETASSSMTFCLFSAQGARPDRGGPSFALKIKGKAETELFASTIARKFAFWPDYIAPTGSRDGWKMADHLLVPLQRLVPSIGVTYNELAISMLKTATGDPRQSAVLENGELRAVLG